MKKVFVIVLTLLSTLPGLHAQPVPLRNDITITKLMKAPPLVTRMAYREMDSSFYLCDVPGNIYKVTFITPDSATYTLMFTSAHHGITYMQGLQFHDSTIYVSGNNHTDSAYTQGLVVRGVLGANGNTQWQVVASGWYETASAFDHYFSGMILNQAGDTIIWCSGARGDHGEEQSRNGQFPGLRNTPHTSRMLAIPANGVKIAIPNDSIGIQYSGFIYCEGVRNTYALAYNASGHLLGCDNSGDRDDDDELNWIRKGLHYGFPYVMGSNPNPQQYPGFNPATDLLINHASSAFLNGFFYNDSTFPQAPLINFQLPCKNNGPDAALYRDSTTGAIVNGALNGTGTSSFTAHRSPLGLVFDKDSLLGSDMKGNGFVLSWTRGDTALAGFSQLLAPFNDHSEDLLMLDMQLNLAGDNYEMNAYRIAENFITPIDAALRDSSLYVIEFDGGNAGSFYRIRLPYTQVSLAEGAPPEELIAYPNPAQDYVVITGFAPTNKNFTVQFYDISGKEILIPITKHFNHIQVPLRLVPNGMYVCKLICENKVFRTKLMVQH
ncbi:MAG: T9SS type A sorting domain-containing protein [Bacteroidetes bacterium]|nr:T9SS type A sorting domain-containing protein [Bacteroidota bacterium]